MCVLRRPQLSQRREPRHVPPLAAYPARQGRRERVAIARVLAAPSRRAAVCVPHTPMPRALCPRVRQPEKIDASTSIAQAQAGRQP